MIFIENFKKLWVFFFFQIALSIRTILFVELIKKELDELIERLVIDFSSDSLCTSCCDVVVDNELDKSFRYQSFSKASLKFLSQNKYGNFTVIEISLIKFIVIVLPAQKFEAEI